MDSGLRNSEHPKRFPGVQNPTLIRQFNALTCPASFEAKMPHAAVHPLSPPCGEHPANSPIRRQKGPIMRTIEPDTLDIAVGELRCVSTHRKASLEELTALRIARDCIDEMLQACVDELKAQHDESFWSELSRALAITPASARKEFDRAGAGSDAPVRKTPQRLASPTERVKLFWRSHRDRFQWDFLPADFLHAVYEHWMGEEFPGETVLPPKTFTRRLQSAVIASPAGWLYTRSRLGSLMDGHEPLAERLKCWTAPQDNNARYGLRRTSCMRAMRTA